MKDWRGIDIRIGSMVVWTDWNNLPAAGRVVKLNDYTATVNVREHQGSRTLKDCPVLGVAYKKLTVVILQDARNY